MNPGEYRIVVTVSRTWQDWDRVRRWLSDVERHHPYGKLTLIHGDHPACDQKVARLAQVRHRRWAIVACPAKWERPDGRTHRGAGLERNILMLTEQSPDAVAAFMQPCVRKNCPRLPQPHPTHGTWHTSAQAADRNIPVTYLADGLEWPPVADIEGEKS